MTPDRFAPLRRFLVFFAKCRQGYLHFNSDDAEALAALLREHDERGAAIREWAQADDATDNVAHQMSAGPERWAREVRLERAEESLRSLAVADPTTPEDTNGIR